MTSANARTAKARSSGPDPAVEQALLDYVAARDARIALDEHVAAADRDVEDAARILHVQAGSWRCAADMVGVNESTLRYHAGIGTKGRRRRPYAERQR